MWTDSGMAWQLFVVFNCLKSHNYNVHVQITTGFFFHNYVCQGYRVPAVKTSDNNHALIS